MIKAHKSGGRMKRELGHLDRIATAHLQENPLWLLPIMRLITIIGDPVIITAVAFVLSLLSFHAGDLRHSYTLLLSCVAVLFSAVLKLALRRARPDTRYARNMWPKTNSFPSGHAFTGVVMGGLGAYFAYQQWPGVAGIALASGITLAIVAVGYSRIYLGAHYVLDVIAGWGLGLVALILLISFAESG